MPAGNGDFTGSTCILSKCILGGVVNFGLLFVAPDLPTGVVNALSPLSGLFISCKSENPKHSSVKLCLDPLSSLATDAKRSFASP